MDNFIPTTITSVEKILKEAYSLGLSEGTKEKFLDEKMRTAFKDIFGEICNLQEVRDEELRVAEEFECSSIENFDKEYKHACQTQMAVLNVKAHPQYIAYSEELDRMAAEAANIAVAAGPSVLTLAEDMEVEEQNVLEMIDPFSKKQILNPVRNRVCGHIYEEETIKEAIKVNNRTKCAYLGCGNRQAVKLQDLVKDDDLRRKIDVAIATQAQQEEDKCSDDSD